ncbi:MAG: SDR family oxidoreductase [Myxococcota bacterium]|nr:SDR family oxidoreductase [Myxococcota bacterium]
MQVEGSAALITGGGTGVGRETTLALARLGCSVVVNYSRSREDAEKTAAEATALGARASAVQGDVSSDADCRRLVDTAVREFGSLQVLVNSAGTTSFIPGPDLEQVTDEVWDTIMAVNVRGLFQAVRAARGAIEAAGGGEIVNLSSAAGLSGQGSSIPYAASKGAVNTLTVGLARVLAPKIRVNAIAPGAITGRWLKAGWGDNYDAIMQAVGQRTPLGRASDPIDVAEAVVGVITGSDMITGQVLVCDGGMLIGV